MNATDAPRHRLRATFSGPLMAPGQVQLVLEKAVCALGTGWFGATDFIEAIIRATRPAARRGRRACPASSATGQQSTAKPDPSYASDRQFSGYLASTRHALARGATIRAELVQVAARPARHGRDSITWHLPQNWPWQDAWLNAFDATHRAPPAAAA